MSQHEYLEHIAWTEYPTLSLLDALMRAGVPLVERPLDEDSQRVTEVPLAWEAEGFPMSAAWSGFASFAESFSEASLPGSERTKLSTLSFFLTREQDALGAETGLVRLELALRVEKYANGRYRGSGEINLHAWARSEDASGVTTVEVDAATADELIRRTQEMTGFSDLLEVQATSALMRRSGT